LLPSHFFWPLAFGLYTEGLVCTVFLIYLWADDVIMKQKNYSFSECSKLVSLRRHIMKLAWPKVIVQVIAVSANSYLSVFPSSFIQQELNNAM
jgi:hypothetical protein